MSAILGTQNGTHSGTQQNTDTDYGKKILSLVKENNKITRKEMAHELSVSLRTIQRIINSLTSLKYVGSGRGGHWEIHE